MNRQHAQRLMNRVLDGVATAQERKLLAAALRADPLLRDELEEVQLAHGAITGLFEQLALDEDFSGQVMRRIQEGHVPSDVQKPVTRPRRRNVHHVRLARTHRNRARAFGVVAGICAAAAVLLAAGVFSGFFARNGIGQVETSNDREDLLADGSDTTPHTGEFDRTDSPARQPHNDRDEPVASDEADPGSNREADMGADAESSPREEDSGDSGHEPEPRPRDEQEPDNQPGPVIDDEAAPDNEHGDEPEIEPQPEPRDVVEREEADGTEADDAEERRPSGEGRTTAREPAAAVGVLTILSGRVDVQSADGAWKRLEDAAELHAGARLKTSASGVAMLSLDSGSITLGKRSEASVQDAQRVNLFQGSAGLDRDPGDDGDALNLWVDAYHLLLAHGAAAIERKLRGFTIKAFGAATLSHDDHGVVKFDEDDACAAEVRFGNELSEPSQGDVTLPAWIAESRAMKVLRDIDDALTVRAFQGNERAYVDRNLPRGLERIMQYPVSCGAVESFLKAALGNRGFDGQSLKTMVDELEIAFLEDTKLEPQRVTKLAELACNVTEDYNGWRSYLYELLHPKPGENPFEKPRGKPPGDDHRKHDHSKAKRVE